MAAVRCDISFCVDWWLWGTRKSICGDSLSIGHACILLGGRAAWDILGFIAEMIDNAKYGNFMLIA
jgi:hypothetical protein